MSYVVEVNNPGSIDEVSEALARKDPSEWEFDMCFYEHLGDKWKNLANMVKKSTLRYWRSRMPLYRVPKTI